MMSNFFKSTLKKLNEKGYIVILSGNSYLIKNKESDNVYGVIPNSTKNKDKLLEQYCNELNELNNCTT